MSRARLRTTLVAGLVAAGAVPLWATPASAEHDAPCSIGEVPGSEQLADTHSRSNPAFERMHVEQAQELATGRGVKVAVIDSGVMPLPGIDRPTAVAVGGASATGILSGHGTIVAGLIAGPRGVAPDAQVFDYKVYDTEVADIAEGEKQVTSAGIVAGIEAVIADHRTQQFDVVNISLAVRQSDPRLEAAVARLVELPLVVVAAAGNVEEGDGPVQGEDGELANPWTGAGVVQAHDALTRELKPGRRGKVETTVAETRTDAQAPPAPQRIDLFSTPRAILLWSGLVAGSLLALAFMLRPLLRR